jgi:hypothetical protein
MATELPSIDELREHFIGIYLDTSEDERTEGREWYPQASRMVRAMAKRGGLTPLRAAAIFSVYSTNNSWKGNVTMATNACAGTPKGMRPVLAKVERIRSGDRPSDVVTSDKLRNFMRNLAGDYSAVTVDRWMTRAAGDESGDQPSGERYAHIAQAIREAAEDLGENPAAMQAILWVAVRGGGE